MLKKLLSLPTLFALVFVASMAHAQQSAPDANAPQSAEDITDDMKEKFVDAYGEIMDIQVLYAEQLSVVTDEEQANALQQQAQAEMQEAVSESGLSIQTYNQIIQLAAADEELMSELEMAIEEEVGS